MDPEPAPSGRFRVIVTRSTEDNRALIDDLAALAIDAIEIPLVSVQEPLDGGRALARAVEQLGDYRWVVLTSVNGVRALKQALADRLWPASVTVAPVGPSTATVARSLGMAVAPPPPIATAKALVDAFVPWDGAGSNRVLAPLADLAGPTVVQGLTAKGYAVERITAYRTEAPEAETGLDVDPGSSADAIAFFSPSVVDRFVARFGRDAVPPIVVCVGPVTAERADRHGLVGVVTASPHTRTGVVEALVRARG